jgi:hypothetical protein
MNMEMGGHGNLPKYCLLLKDEAGGGAAPGKEQESIEGQAGGPEKPGKQGSDQDEHPVNHYGMIEI